MTWPTSDVDTTKTDAGTDDPSQARPVFADLITKFNQMRNHVSAFIQGLLDDSNAAMARTTLGLGTAAVKNTGTTVDTVPLLGANGGHQQPGTAAEVIKILRGNFTSSGALADGSGLSAVKNSTGDYTVTYGTTFSTKPTVVVSGESTSFGALVDTPGCLPGSAHIQTYNRSTFTLADAPFSFIAAGPA